MNETTCWTCKGAGYVQVQGSFPSCAVCKGSGKADPMPIVYDSDWPEWAKGGKPR
jgi:RecJ-like exonuclease